MRRLAVLPVIALTLFSTLAYALPKAKVKMVLERHENRGKSWDRVVLPYFFSTDTMGLNLGVGAMQRGLFQEQVTVGATAYGGDVSHAVSAGLWNLRLPYTKRFFASAIGFAGYFPDKKVYGGSRGAMTPPGVPLPGSNDSDQSQFLMADGSSNFWDVKLEYALPLGATRDEARVNYQLRNGMLVSEPSGGEAWDPLESGATVAVLRQFNRYQDFELNTGTVDGTVHGVEFGLLYDNTDFPVNPSYGSRQYLSAMFDNGWLDSDQQWQFYSLEASKFFSFGETERAHQRVLALNLWTGYSPSWEVDTLADGSRVVNGGAPYNEGATLGGFYRMRGYDNNRFHDKAVFYTAAEYRHTLKYNPVADVSWLRFLRMDWIQLVGFVEAGRVGEAYTANALLTDLKFDVGGSVRAMMAGTIVRMDIATSDETTNMWVMIDHPF